MLANAGGAQAQELVRLGRTLPAGQWHEVTKINGATVYLVRAEPRERDYDMHDDVDEFVITLEGTFKVETPEGIIAASPGESLLVPRGVRHRTKLDDQAIILLVR